MAKKKTHRMECGHCGDIMTSDAPCCREHSKALAKESLNLCTACGKYFDTKKELAGHSHKEAA